MADLVVDTVVLREAAAGLREAGRFASDAGARSGRLHDLGAEAGADASRAVHDFLRRWSYGLGLIADDVATLAGVLDRAAESFEAVESQLRDGLR